LNNNFGMANPIIDTEELILITGASGFIGSRVTERLIHGGFKNLRCFVRRTSDLRFLKQLAEKNADISLEILAGDLASKKDCRRAVRDASLIFHLAAGFGKSFRNIYRSTVAGTRNVLDAAAEQQRIKRFVNVSSFTVYSTRNLPGGAVLDESCGVYQKPGLKGEAYCCGKVLQEELVREYHDKYGITYVIVRPGFVYGPGKTEISGRVGLSKGGFFLHMGGSNRIPLVYVDNCADAIVLSGLREGIEGRVFNIVDDDPPRSNEFLSLYMNNVTRMKSVNIPKFASYLLCAFWGFTSRITGGRLSPTFNLYRWSDDWKGHLYSNEKIKMELGWKQRVSFEEGMRRYFESCRNAG